MNLKLTTIAAVLTTALGAQAQQTTEINEFNLAGPFAVSAPVAFDTVDVKGKAFDEKSLLENVGQQAVPTTVCKPGLLPSLKDSRSVGVLSFYINNADFLEGKLKVNGAKNHKVYVDGTEASAELKLAPEHHTVAIKFMAEPSDTDSISVAIESAKAVEWTLSKRHPYMGHDLFDGRRVRGVSLSPDGSYLVASYQTTERGGNSRWDYELMTCRRSKAEGQRSKAANSPWQLVRHLSRSVHWMPTSTAWLEEEKEQGVRTLYKVDPATGSRTLWAGSMPDGGYTVSPTEDYIIINGEDEGPKEDPDVFEVLEIGRAHV